MAGNHPRRAAIPMTRLEVIYIALQRLDSREIMRKVIEKDYTEYGDENG